MADELDPVEQQFLADMADYLAKLEEATAAAQEFADANREAEEALGGLRDDAAETAVALDEDRDKELEAAEALGHLRDEALEAAEAMGHLRDESLEAGAAADVAKDGEGGGGGFEGLTGVLPALIGLGVAMLPTLGGLVTGLLAAGAGAGAFAALAYPAYEQVTTQMTAMATETKKQQDAWDKAHPAAAQLINDITGFKTAWQQAGTAVTPIVDTIAGQLTKIGTTVLPEIVPLAKAFGGAMSTALGQIETAVKGTGFKDFLHMLTELQGPAMKGIGSVLSAAAGGLAKFMTAMAPQVPGAFAFLASGVRGLFDGLDDLTKILGPLQAPLRGFLEALGHALLDSLQKDTPALEGLAGAGGKFLTALTPLLPQIVTLSTQMVTLATKGLPLLGFLIRLAGDVARCTPVVEGIGVALTGVGGIIAEFMPEITELVRAFKSDFDQMMSYAKLWWSLMKQAFDEVSAGAAELWHKVASSFDSLRHSVASSLDQDLSLLRAWPGRVLSALGNLGGLLVNAGRALIEGLLRGIEGEAGGVLSYVRGLASDISGIFASVMKAASPSMVFDQHGRNMMAGLLQGIRATAPQVISAVRQVAQQAGGIGFGGVAPGGGSATAPSVHVTVPLTIGAGAQAYSSPAFLQYINQVVQEATLRYSLVNPTNGLNLQGKLS